MADCGKFFLMRSHLNGLVADIQGGEAVPNTPLVTWTQNEEGSNNNQLFFECPLTGTIRSKLDSDMCLDVDDEGFAVLMPVQHGDRDQAWDRTSDMLVNRLTGKALDIQGGDSSSGARLLSWDPHGNDNQKWTFDYQAPRYFFIVSDLNGKVLDISAADTSPGAKVIMWTRNDSMDDNQLWYEDKDGIIRSKLNDYALDASGDELEMQPYEAGNSNQRFCFDCQSRGMVAVDDRGSCLDIVGEDTEDGAKLCKYSWKESSNQMWRLDYV